MEGALFRQAIQFQTDSPSPHDPLGNSPLVPWNLGRVNWDGREFSVGEELAKEGLQATYPVVLIPGIVRILSLPL